MKNETAQRIQSHLRSLGDDMIALLKRYAAMETPSRTPATQQPMLELLSEELERLGFRCRALAGRKTGGQLLAVHRDYRRGQPKQLILGHCDTVWPQGTLASMPVRSQQGKLFGPGVYDMKGGLVQALFALRALRDLELNPKVVPLVFVNTDEEIGSPESTSNILRVAKIVDRAFVVEPALGSQGRLKTSRKGVGHFTVRVTGRAAHAGLDPDKGISAIVELSHVIQRLAAMNDPQRGTTVNVGMIAGGTNANVIASESTAEIDVRVRTKADAERIEQAIHALEPTVDGAQLDVSGCIGRPPMESTPRNRILWQRAAAAAEALQLPLDEGAAGGGSDGNWTSLHTATLDGLGAVGDGAHATHEHLIEAQMPERAALLACLLLGDPLG